MLSLINKKQKVLENSPEELVTQISRHLEFLDNDYLNEYPAEEIIEHAKILSNFKPEKLFILSFKTLEVGYYSITILGVDLIGLVAAATGILSSLGFDIRTGKVFSYHPPEGGPMSGSGKRVIIQFDTYYNQEISDSDQLKDQIQSQLFNCAKLLKQRNFEKVRMELFERMGKFLVKFPEYSKIQSELPFKVETVFYDKYTEIIVTGPDSRALLFSFTSALNLRGVLIHKIISHTFDNTISDRFFVTDKQYRPVSDSEFLGKLKTAIVMTQRFVRLLPLAPNFSQAVSAFNKFLDKLFTEASNENINLLSFQDYNSLSALSRLFGMGPFHFEQFAKLHLDSLNSLIGNLENEKKFQSLNEYRLLLTDRLQGINELNKQFDGINQFKDYQLFRLDLLHTAFPSFTLEQFGEQLSNLAEALLEQSLEVVFRDLRRIHGRPVYNEKECEFAALALGKFGGKELGYGSDLELIFIYSGSGNTFHDTKSITNAEFFIKLVRTLTTKLQVKSSGIFELDLRLRPHGEAGPLASSFPAWEDYYSSSKGAVAFEKQALIKLRPVWGGDKLTSDIMQARDRILYGNDNIDLNEILELRKKQLKAKTSSNRINAKFSPGGLVEIEYSVQFYQIQYGRQYPDIRNPNTLQAMEQLLDEELLRPSEFEMLYNAYAFFRRLINALRMVRGNAKDLEVPASQSDEFKFLARRMGYAGSREIQPETQLNWDLNRSLNNVKWFFQSHFLNSEAPPQREESFIELLHDSSLPKEELLHEFETLGIKQPEIAWKAARRLLDQSRYQAKLLAVLVLALRRIRLSADPDTAFVQLCRFLEEQSDQASILRLMINHTPVLDVCIKAFAFSDFLTSAIFENPAFLTETADPGHLEQSMTQSDYTAQLEKLEDDFGENWITGLHKFKDIHLLRIGLRDIYLNDTLEKITREISDLTISIIDWVYKKISREFPNLNVNKGQVVIAMGKLGGRELNYSSDIDLVFVYDKKLINPDELTQLRKFNENFIKVFQTTSKHGKLYRVDLNLRPYGAQGELSGSREHYRMYYSTQAEGWELQAWLKSRPVAGNAAIGRDIIQFVHKIAVDPKHREKVEKDIRKMRLLALDRLRKQQNLAGQVKSGPGGIRTIEFYVQALQMKHAHELPELLTGNTLAALHGLYRYKLLSQNYFQILSNSYTFLRRVEHYIQLEYMQQKHELPSNPQDFEKLAKRMGYEDRLGNYAWNSFLEEYRKTMLTLSELSGNLFEY